MEHSVKLVMEKWAVFVKVLQTTQSLDISRCCFAEDENKFTKVYAYGGRAQPFFCSLNLSFSDIAVAVSVVIFLNSLLSGNTHGTAVTVAFANIFFMTKIEKKYYQSEHN